MATPIKRNINFSVLNQEKIDKIHEKSMYIMENIGMKVTGERAVKLLLDNGATLGDDGLIRITRTMVDKALKSAPKEITLYTRDGQPAMVINSENQVYFGTHSDQLEIVDPFTNTVRQFLKKDIQTMCKVADYLPNIYFVLSVGMTADVDPKVQTQSTFIETVKNFSKTINFSTNDIESLQDIIDIAADIAGGLDKLQEKPFIFNYCEPIPPLTHPLESTEKIYISAENRIPFVYMPYCMMGGTSPMSKAATLAQCNAEALAGLVLTQLVSEGAPFIYGAMPSVFDMRTSIGSYAAPEFHLNIAAMADLVAYYGLPFYGTAGCSDAKVIDEQAVAEASVEIFSTMLSKANIIHDVGVMDHCKSVSPELVVLANEIIEGLKHYTAGIEVADEDFAIDVIEKVGPGGHYLGETHTNKNFRKVWYPSLFSRKMNNEDFSEVSGKIKVKIADILKEHEVPKLDDSILEKLAKWEQKLGL
ncbi:trimethylamine methyltransferase family protein [Sporomusa malonica]|uniref:Trimethylamine---corrinoid protein Co-methyltransferase n=1 Tax=Sporomusa malonica TaxID=112901 RepID=A0A1W2EPY4_9FIRM|nr:trimethylamine methyltransferase family protein [Sporomusa malonica]SMD11787.1 trimethylamine---corrinoid protein Co-methyltransferase [Sporomusa malonica]